MSSNTMRVLVTGAAGFIGSHVAEQAVAAGYQVRGVVLPEEDTSLLREWGVEIVVGDLSDPEVARRAVAGCEVIYNAMGSTSIYGPRDMLYRANVWATESLIQAAAAAGVRRLVHASSYMVSLGGSFHYWKGGVIAEQTPAQPRFWRWDYYAASKVAAEQAVLQAHDEGLLEVVLLRIGWVYGSRNQVSFPVLVDMLRREQLLIIGDGRNRLGLVHVADVARAFLLAANSDVATGRLYVIEGVADQPAVTQASFLNAMADLVEAPRPRRRVPLGVALSLGTAVEIIWHLLRREQQPPLTTFIVHLLGRDQQFDTSRAEHELGWRPQVGFEAGMREIGAWLQHQPSTVVTTEALVR
ncbi:MAG: NAD-dependent epimerase/dehydratase family protein [Chloroflexi bacterium]|nr:NAD-dependent epimerase/dehydratase family protein [Chloroflexota bacterium]MCI0578572.1 NAD-dependent epimerase/dehydratase family protein [Chloroflexota bacterium]MCI0647331.1 NAD-dependent epimerase/dehydratase family protein [Chloroflexota bacterium]MCI0727791.1 NAD-dependent epimerase/dehydratase family protein [Chloroflexota bacterium]